MSIPDDVYAFRKKGYTFTRDGGAEHRWIIVFNGVTFLSRRGTPRLFGSRNKAMAFLQAHLEKIQKTVEG